MTVKQSAMLYTMIKENGLYNVLKDELIYNGDYKLTDDVRQEIRKIISENAEIDVEDIDLMTIGELEEYILYEMPDHSLPEWLIPHIDIASVIYDMILNGDINYLCLEVDSRSVIVFWRQT